MTIIILLKKEYLNLEDKYMTKEEWANLQGMTHSELKKHNRLKRKEFNKNTDQQKKENKEK